MEFFGATDLVDKGSYQAAMLRACGTADRAFRLGDCAWLERIRADIFETRHRIPDSCASTYQYGYCDVTLLHALCLCNRGEFERVLTLCQAVEFMRHYAELERIGQGRGPHPLAVTLTTLLNALGEAKWQADAQHRDCVMTPEEMAQRWYQLMQRVPDYAARKWAKHTERYRDCMDRLAWAGLQVAKTLTRYCPERVSEFMAFYNGRFGPTLEEGIGSYCYKPLAPNDPKYWDYELAKLIIAGKLTDQDESIIRQRRRETYLECIPASDTVAGFDSDAEFDRWRGLRLVSA